MVVCDATSNISKNRNVSDGKLLPIYDWQFQKWYKLFYHTNVDIDKFINTHILVASKVSY